MSDAVKDAIARVRAAHDQAEKHESLSATIYLPDIRALILLADRKDGAMNRVNQRLRDRLDILEAEIRRLDPENALVAPSPELRQMLSAVSADIRRTTEGDAT